MIKEKIHERQSCGTHYFTVRGENLNEEIIEKALKSYAPFGMDIKINREKTSADVKCYYD